MLKPFSMSNIIEDEKYKRILQDHEAQIAIWAERINHYRQTSFSNLNDEEQGKLDFEITGYLHDILKIFTGFGKFKDEFINPTYFLNVEGLEAHITAKKTGQRFDFGFDFKGVYLNIYIPHNEYIKNVPDEFWSLLLRLSGFGEFNFEENGGFMPAVKQKYPHLFKPTKSNVFRLARNYFLSEFLYDDDPRRPPVCDLGWLYIRWSPDKYSIDEMLVCGCESFKILYKLTYLLWKAHKAS